MKEISIKNGLFSIVQYCNSLSKSEDPKLTMCYIQ